MLRLVLLVCLFAAAAAVPVESDTEFCNGQTECPQDCGFVSRNSKCVYCRCGDSPLVFPEPEPEPKPLPLPLPEPVCEHGPAFIDECDNDCKCVKGGVYGCTRKLCKPGQTSQKPKACSGSENLPKRSGQRVFCHDGIVKVQSEDAKCLPGAVFMDAEDCNSCTCSKTGAAGCTLKFCIPQTRTDAQPVCEHGPAFIDECDNDCKCVKGGVYGCTRKLCKPGQTSQKPKTCSGSGNLPKRSGQRVSCHDGIVKVQSEDAKCLPGAVFMDAEDCNTCSCSDTGVAGCTFKFCLPTTGADTLESDTEFCNGETECPQDCGFVSRNSKCVYCRCGDSPLVIPEPKPKTQPVPGPLPVESDTEFCNGETECPQDCGFVSRNSKCVYCRCGDSPLVIPEPKPKTEPVPGPLPEPKGCPYGPGFIDECNNDCNCVDGRFYGCTKKACKPGEQPELPMKCSSSDNLPPRDGVHVYCNDGIVKLQKKEAGCEHGPGFIDECNNDCNCVDGQSYGCTKKACKPGEQSAVPMKCSSSDNLPPRDGVHVFCNDGIVKLQKPELGAPCGTSLPGGGAGAAYAASGAAAGVRAADQVTCTVSASQPCPAGSRFVRFVGLTKVCGPARPVCPHGEEFIDECGNDCRCLRDGYACTKKSCKQGQTALKPMACEGTKDLPERKGRRVFCHEKIVKVQDQDAVCLPGAVFADGCNDCFCTDAGTSGCTLKACLGVESESTVTCEGGFPQCAQDCGQVYNAARDCYDCPCGVGGPGDVTAQFGEPCPPGTIHSASGAFFKSCKPSDKCPHGLEFIDECSNDCRCMADGYGCTRKACRPGQTSMKPMECEGSGQLPDRKGKRVFCHEGIVKMQNEDASCIPGSVFKNDCNSCFCGENGLEGCTEKFCLKQ